MRRGYVLDTSILVAAFRSSEGASRRRVTSALNRKFVLLMSGPLFLEYEAVLKRPEHLAASDALRHDVDRVLEALATVAVEVRLAFRWKSFVADPADDMVLEEP